MRIIKELIVTENFNSNFISFVSRSTIFISKLLHREKEITTSAKKYNSEHRIIRTFLWFN